MSPRLSLVIDGSFLWVLASFIHFPTKPMNRQQPSYANNLSLVLLFLVLPSERLWIAADKRKNEKQGEAKAHRGMKRYESW
jgi:hypothetical protein